MTPAELVKLQQYLQQKFGNDNFKVAARKEDANSVEVLLGSEFIGVIYKDEDEGEVSYDFNMAILEIDLPGAA